MAIFYPHQVMQQRKHNFLIHTVDMHSEPATLSLRPEQTQAFKPPLPPPPNPKYLQSESIAESDEPTSDEFSDSPHTHPENSPYEVQTEGPLTYFNYYFEELGTVAASDEAESKSNSKLAVGMVGAGVVAATVVSGLVIGDALQRAQAPEDGQPKNTSLKRSSAEKPTRTPAVSPERQEVERSPVQKTSPSSTPTLPAKPKPGKTSFLSAPELQLPPPAVPIAAPETLALAPTRSAPPNVSPTAPTPRQPSPWVAANVPQMSVQEAANRQAAGSLIAQPEKLPTERQNSSQGTPLPPMDAGANADREPLPSPAIAPSATSSTQTESSNGTPAATGENNSSQSAAAPLPNQPSNEETSGLQQLFPVKPSDAGTGDRATATSTTSTASQPQEQSPSTQARGTQGIQAYINLPRSLPPDRTVSLMPLSQQAAVEAANTTKVGEFAVRQVNTQEYQKEWATSSKTDDSDLANAFPAYGFIDYQRQVIVVLQAKPDTATLQSQQPSGPNS
jgi:hypothetical protein